MTNTNIIANELTQAGFVSAVFSKKMVLVSLTNRQISTMEVKTELMKISDIRFSFSKQNNGSVLVTW